MLLDLIHIIPPVCRPASLQTRQVAYIPASLLTYPPVCRPTSLQSVIGIQRRHPIWSGEDALREIAGEARRVVAEMYATRGLTDDDFIPTESDLGVFITCRAAATVLQFLRVNKMHFLRAIVQLFTGNTSSEAGSPNHMLTPVACTDHAFLASNR